MYRSVGLGFLSIQPRTAATEHKLVKNFETDDGEAECGQDAGALMWANGSFRDEVKDCAGVARDGMLSQGVNWKDGGIGVAGVR